MPWFSSPLDDVRIASPCPASWDEMYGDGRRRLCAACKLNVYNLSGMTRDEAERLVTNAEGRLCVRFFRRRDGSIITADCPVGWERVKQKTRRHLTAAFSMLAALFSGTFVASYVSKDGNVAIAGAMERIVQPEPLMGNVVIGVLPNKERQKAPAHESGRTLGRNREIN